MVEAPGKRRARRLRRGKFSPGRRKNDDAANVKDFGARGNGTSDDTPALLAALASSPSIVIPPGTYLHSATLPLNAEGMKIRGAGAATMLKVAPGYTDTSQVAITADMCGVESLRFVGGASSTSSSNPAIGAGAVSVVGARYVELARLRFFYVNGRAIDVVGSATVNTAGGQLKSILVEHCAAGIRILGNAGSNNVGQMLLEGIHLEVIDNGDGLLLEDVNDCTITNLIGAVAGAAVAGSLIHVRGACASNFFQNFDVGAISRSTASAAILVEAGGNGSPTNTSFTSGVAQNAKYGAQVTGASADTAFERVTFKQSDLDGVNVTATGNASFDNCVWKTNNQSGNAAAYDISLNNSSGFVYFRGGRCESPVAASTAGSVTRPVNDAQTKGHFIGVAFIGGATTPSTVFQGTPQIARGCPGYNPRGSVTAPAIGASPATVNTQYDGTLFITATLPTSLTIGGVTVPGLALNTPYRVAARQAMVFTYPGAAPTITFIAE